jgi:hypothetical protein
LAGNLQRGGTLTIPLSGLVSEVYTLGTEGLLSLQVPTLDSGTFAISGCASGSFQMLPIFDETGVQVLTIPATTGQFVLGSKALADIAGLAQIQVGVSAPQNTGARVVVLKQKTEER